MKVDFFNGVEWIKHDIERYNGVENIEQVESIFPYIGDTIKAEYKNGKVVVYKDIFGTYVAQYEI